MRTYPICLSVFLALLLAAPAAAKDDDYAKLAPFTAARFEGEQVHIEVEGTWYRLKAIDKVKATDLVAFAKKTFKEKWQERITEDLVEVLAKMGHKPGRTVALQLVTEDGKPVSLPRVAMTRENRQRARRAFEEPKRPRRRDRKDDDDLPKLAPFTAARVEQGNLTMEVNGVWYRLRSIDGIRAAELLRFAQETYGDRMEKRLIEDLVEVMARMGKRPGRTVALELERVEDGQAVSLPKVPMTEDKRRQAWRARSVAARGAPARRSLRKHARVAKPQFAHLTKLVEGARDRIWLSRQQAHEDLDQLEWLIQNVHSYATLRGIDIEAALDAARLGIPARISRNTFAIQVMKVLALLGDGHARVAENPARVLAPGFLPFLISDAGGKPVAFKEDRSSWLDPNCPYVTKLDEVPVDRWVEAASHIVANGSPQLVRQRALGILRHVQHVRRELGLDESDTITVELASADGKRRETKQVRVADRKPIYGTWPRTSTAVLTGDIAYLRIPRMEDLSQFRGLPSASFAGLKGLVIDVRGNGGGTRDALRQLLPAILAKGEAVVANVAAYRLPPGAKKNRAGHLQDRSLFPTSADSVSAEDRSVMRDFARGFQPAWTPPEGFSDWHYLVIRNTGTASFDGPAIVLIDSGCFSATDIFVGAFKGRENVAVMGTATSGGSGRSRSYKLAHSRLRLRLSSMASFRPNGQLYDTQGIAPDVEVPVAPTDLIGRTDRALEAALERLKK